MDEGLVKKLDIFFSKYNSRRYKKGEILIRADDNPSGVFYLKDGKVKEYAISKKGDELIVNIFRPISFFPMSWAINDTPNEYFFEAMTDLIVIKAPRADVINFIKNDPDVLFNLMGRVYRGFDSILTRMIYLMSGGAYARLITELIIQAKRFGKKQDRGIELVISEKDIAASSGMTRETVSREIKILKDKGLVTLSKNILIIKHLKQLEEELLK